jgi:hypothetical protein
VKSAEPRLIGTRSSSALRFRTSLSFLFGEMLLLNLKQRFLDDAPPVGAKHPEHFRFEFLHAVGFVVVQFTEHFGSKPELSLVLVHPCFKHVYFFGCSEEVHNTEFNYYLSEALYV